MESHNGNSADLDRPIRHTPEHRHKKEPPAPVAHQAVTHTHGSVPIDDSFRLVVRTVLWVIIGAVIVGFVIWWAMT